MIDNTKEYILCAAYRQKRNTANRQKLLEDNGKDVAEIYYKPQREVFDMRLGWRHPDIIYQYGDEIDQSDRGGFCTSRGRYVDRMEAYKIALECGQIKISEEESKKIEESGEYPFLYSEDLY